MLRFFFVLVCAGGTDTFPPNIIPQQNTQPENVSVLRKQREAIPAIGARVRARVARSTVRYADVHPVRTAPTSHCPATRTPFPAIVKREGRQSTEKCPCHPARWRRACYPLGVLALSCPARSLLRPVCFSCIRRLAIADSGNGERARRAAEHPLQDTSGVINGCVENGPLVRAKTPEIRAPVGRPGLIRHAGLNKGAVHA